MPAKSLRRGTAQARRAPPPHAGALGGSKGGGALASACGALTVVHVRAPHVLPQARALVVEAGDALFQVTDLWVDGQAGRLVWRCMACMLGAIEPCGCARRGVPHGARSVHDERLCTMCTVSTWAPAAQRGVTSPGRGGASRLQLSEARAALRGARPTCPLDVIGFSASISDILGTTAILRLADGARSALPGVLSCCIELLVGFQGRLPLDHGWPVHNYTPAN